ncbi:efflux RND transporter periplasmic adaptor subunit [Undibacterium sp. RuRC25W]|uniref:efflux RND transporter periplasmic adaptor subunit n=1 Tax=Undibacterium sp. RuRC25W TaxID=3413047 RepID=UPI003BF1F099
MTIKKILVNIVRVAVTIAIVALAVFCGKWLWQHYEVAPWTRDARVKANIVQIASDLSGEVTQLAVHDNQQVVKGQLLFEIDRARYEIALRQAQAQVKTAQINLDQAAKEAHRNTELRELVAQESREQSQTHMDQAKTALEQAQISVDLAKLNLQRTRIYAAVDGSITNLDLRVGSYVTASRAVMALVENNSFYVEAYFEETKLPFIHVNDTASVTLMGSQQALSGTVESLAAGIVDRDRSTGSNLLPNVNPTFNWVRLAQRIPVRIHLAPLPKNTRLIAGETATVSVGTTAHSNDKSGGVQ